MLYFCSYILGLFLLGTIIDIDIQRIAKKFAFFFLSYISPSKFKSYRKIEDLFNKYVDELKLKVTETLDNQNKLLDNMRWLGNRSLSIIQEIKINNYNFEVNFDKIQEINSAFELGLSDLEKRKGLYSYRKNEDSDWWQTEKRIKDANAQIEEEIINKEQSEILNRERAIENERLRNEKRLIALAEYEKKREEENRIYEENRQQRLKEAEVKRREREIILRIEQEKRKQQKEEEKFQKFLKKQIEKTNNLLKPKSKIKKPRIKVNKVIPPDKLKQIVERKLTIGTLGEQLIFEELKSRLIGTIYQTLIEEFKHVSIEYGDGLGYDILAYNESAKKIYVEVKTTTAKYPVASFSRNEISFANQFDENYVLFLVHNLNIDDNSYEYIEINEFSNVKEQLNFQPISYKLKIKDNLTNQNNQLNQ